MGKPVRLSSVTIKFGASPGANVQLKVGDSDARSQTNLESMTTVASAGGIGGTYTFHATSKTAGEFLVIWFTKMPPAASGKYMAQVFSIIVHGTAASTS